MPETKSNQSLQDRQNRHSTTQLCLVALLALLISLIILTHNAEFEKPLFIVTKVTLCVGLLLAYALEGLWMYE
jgi:hypothetical protein